MSFFKALFGGRPEAPLCRKPWFDPRSQADQKVTTYDEPQDPLEVDTLEALKAVQEPRFSPRNRFIVYQQWGAVEPDGSRPYFWLDKPAAQAVAQAIAGGPARSLILLCTTFQKGAIRQFSDTLSTQKGAGEREPLEMLGFFWYFSGDTIDDEPESADEIAYAANRLNLSRLSLLTGTFSPEIEDRLLRGLKDNVRLKRFGAFGKDESYTWPAFAAPRLEAFVAANRD